ncbi:hypothetical protein K2173_017634 [Erythroxylum novogranatense]|uniref:Cytochrome c oxidase assembly factor 6 n=1 Tax=Erythroxylum novogranatense TaxID=1862640 RepID=A0AAV8SM59_9ROSI|nr:hypothetical protein K2173_017634 [Erythroxylum novogranatense]
MDVKTYASRDTDQVHTDVLSEARAACYKARDSFYACLEKASLKKPTEIASVGLMYPSDCKGARVEYEKNCRASWVKHFDRLYCRNKRVQRLLDDRDTRRGPLSLPQPYTFKNTPS